MERINTRTCLFFARRRKASTTTEVEMRMKNINHHQSIIIMMSTNNGSFTYEYLVSWFETLSVSNRFIILIRIGLCMGVPAHAVRNFPHDCPPRDPRI